MFACLTVDVQLKRKLPAKHKNCKKAKKKKKVNWLIIYFWNLFKSCFLTTLQILAAIQSCRCLGVVAQIIMLRGLCPLVCAWGEWWGLHGVDEATGESSDCSFLPKCLCLAQGHHTWTEQTPSAAVCPYALIRAITKTSSSQHGAIERLKQRREVRRQVSAWQQEVVKCREDKEVQQKETRMSLKLIFDFFCQFFLFYHSICW